MDRDTFEQFKSTLQGQLDGLIAPRMRTDGGFASGGVDAPPPISPDQAVAGFNELLAALGNKANAWSLDRAAAQRLVDDAGSIYLSVHTGWVVKDLATDAPPQIVAWQKAEREKLAAGK